MAYLHTQHVHHIGFTGHTPGPMHMHTDTVIHRVEPHKADAHTNTHNYRCKYVPNHTTPSRPTYSPPVPSHSTHSPAATPHPLPTLTRCPNWQELPKSTRRIALRLGLHRRIFSGFKSQWMTLSSGVERYSRAVQSCWANLRVRLRETPWKLVFLSSS